MYGSRVYDASLIGAEVYVSARRSMKVALKNGYDRKCVLIDKDFQFQYLLTWICMTMALLGGLVLASVSMVFLFKVRTFNYLVVGNGVAVNLLCASMVRAICVAAMEVAVFCALICAACCR